LAPMGRPLHECVLADIRLRGLRAALLPAGRRTLDLGYPANRFSNNDLWGLTETSVTRGVVSFEATFSRGNQESVTKETQLTAFPQNCRSPTASSSASKAVNATNTAGSGRYGIGGCGTSVPRSPSLA